MMADYDPATSSDEFNNDLFLGQPKERSKSYRLKTRRKFKDRFPYNKSLGYRLKGPSFSSLSRNPNSHLIHSRTTIISNEQLSYSGKATIAILSTCGLLFVFVAIFLIYNRRKEAPKKRESYDPIPETRLEVPFNNERRKSSCVSGLNVAMYSSCVPQRQSIDFIVPKIPTPGLNVPSASCENLSCTPSGSKENIDSTAESNLVSLSGLNPELYKIGLTDSSDEFEFPGDHLGRLWFSIHFNSSNEQLVIVLVKAKNLPSRVRGSSTSCDPFIRIYLLPEERRYVQSKQKKKTCNPKFDETFVFQVPAKTLLERTLRLSCYDNDRGRRHNLIGHVIVNLKDLDLSSSGKIYIWKDLTKDTDESPSDLGEIYISLCYNPSIERLTTTICEAKDLQWPDGRDDPLETYVKILFMNGNKIVKTKKTATVKRSLLPNYNESFHYKLPVANLDMANVVLQVVVAQGTHKDKCLGRIVLGSFMFARGKALDHWNTATVSTCQKQCRQWHKLT